ncbi:MAG TPA: sigma-70 family RNA polymerase sigma factor [Polyangiaceae bacterium]|jgi:RNA polymerase sigma-70 factor (ECF subfamily)
MQPFGAGSFSQPLSSPSEVNAELRAIYAKWANFVWLTLQRLGVRYDDLEDVCHDVFVIAHRKLPEFDKRTQVNAWLFGICVRVAANYRRRAHIRLEQASGSLNQEDGPNVAAPEWTHPDQEFVRRETRARVEAIFDRMDLPKRAVFLMFEVEGLSCKQIAEQLGLPIGTVYSRLHAARQYVLQEIERQTGAKKRAVKGRAK